MIEKPFILVQHNTQCTNQRLLESLNFTSRNAGNIITACEGTIYFIDSLATITIVTERYVVVTPFDVIAVLYVYGSGVDSYLCTYDDETYNELFSDDLAVRSQRGW